VTLTEIAWLGLAAYALHMLEEFALDWKDWARGVIGLPVEWTDFYMTNAIVVVLGIVQAQLAATIPLIPLIFASLMLINATFFHVLPFLVARGRYSPGLATAVLFFYPAGAAAFLIADRDGALTPGVAAAAVLGGAALMAFPVVLIRLRGRPYFRQT
jgi:hypothetical protein